MSDWQVGLIGGAIGYALFLLHNIANTLHKIWLNQTRRDSR